MQAALKNNNNFFTSFAGSLDASDNGRRGVATGSSKEKLSMQNAFRAVNDQQVVGADRDALAGGMVMDCLFGALTGLPTVDLGNGIEAGSDMIADVVDEFWTEMRRKNQQAPQAANTAPQSTTNFIWSGSTSSKDKKKAAESWESWMKPAPYVLQPSI